MMTKWMMVKEIKGETGVYEKGKEFICGEALVFAMSIGTFNIRCEEVEGAGWRVIQREVWRVQVPSLKLSVLATREGVTSCE